MYASRVRGVEVSSFTPPTAVNRKPASTKTPKVWPSASRSPVPPPLSDNSPVKVNSSVRQAARTKAVRRSDLRARLAAVHGHPRPADPARARRTEERDARPDFFGAAEAPKRQLPLHEVGNSGRV